MHSSARLSLGDTQRAFVWIATTFFLITWLKGFRFPNLWSATHFAFNYSQGFVRRGLIGEIARQIGGDEVFRYETFIVFAFSVFLVVAAYFALAIRRAVRCDPRDLGLKVAVLVYASSPGLIFFIHSVGYNDYIGLLIVLVLVYHVSHSTKRYLIFYLVVVSSAVSALVHEGLAIMFGPVLIFAMVCHILRLAMQRTLDRHTWLILLTHALVTSGILLSLSSLVSLIGVESLETVQALKRHIVQNADFPVRHEAFEALQRSSRENVMRLMPWYWSVKGHWPGAIWSWQAFAPGFAWLLTYGFFAIRRANLPSASRWILGLLFVAASLAPLAFNFVGWDWGRWNGLALIATVVTLLVLKMYFPTRAEDSSPLWLLVTGAMAAALGLASSTSLFDGFQVQFFPFREHQDLLERLIEDGFQYRPRG